MINTEYLTAGEFAKEMDVTVRDFIGQAIEAYFENQNIIISEMGGSV